MTQLSSRRNFLKAVGINTVATAIALGVPVKAAGGGTDAASQDEDVYNDIAQMGKYVGRSIDDINENITSVKDLSTQIIYDNINLFQNSKIYGNIYYAADGQVMGTPQDYISDNWSIAVIPVKKGSAVKITGNNSLGGSSAFWLNSSNYGDVKSCISDTKYINKTILCEADYIGIPFYNLKKYESNICITPIYSNIELHVEKGNDLADFVSLKDAVDAINVSDQ